MVTKAHLLEISFGRQLVNQIIEYWFGIPPKSKRQQWGVRVFAIFDAPFLQGNHLASKIMSWRFCHDGKKCAYKSFKSFVKNSLITFLLSINATESAFFPIACGLEFLVS